VKQLTITLDGPGVGESNVAVDDLAAVLTGVQGALRLMVENLGGRTPGPGRPPAWAREQSALQLTATGTGSFVASVSLRGSSIGQANPDDFGPRALDALLSWDGREDSNLPRAVTDKLYDASSALSYGVRLWLGSETSQHKVEVRRIERVRPSPSVPESALLHGWLQEVNWDKGTAQVHDASGGYTRLLFDSALSHRMQRLATQFVEVRGRGQFNDGDEWISVQVDRITKTPSGREPIDLGAVLNDPSPKRFDPDRMVTASEPFDVDKFVRVIHEGRDVGKEGSPGWSS
jgi:hypothetical protein